MLQNCSINDEYDYTERDANGKDLLNSKKKSILLLDQEKTYHRNERQLEKFTLQTNRLLDELSAEKEIVLLENYLLFCTARDCSILISFQEFHS